VFIYTPARWGQRFCAFVLDLFILDWVCLPLIFLISPEQDARVFVLARLWLMVTYFAAMESSVWQATLGKLLFGLRVSRLDNTPAGFLQSLQRICLGTCLLGIGFFRALWNPHALAFHDELTQTCVLEDWWDEQA
jgi:uncharacterized RDD family membrane protein YckC